MAETNEERLERLTDALEELTSTLTENNKKLDDAVKKQGESRKNLNKTNQQLLHQQNLFAKTMQNTSLDLVKMTTSLFTLHSALADVKGANDRLVKGLAQVGLLNDRNYKATLSVFNNMGVGIAQATQAISEVIGEGMSRFSTEVMKFTGQMKLMGVSNKGLLRNMRFNTQALGFSEESSLSLARAMVTTGIQFGNSIEDLVGAVNSMKDALMNTSAELGPNMSRSIQEAAIILSRGNTELQGQVSRFLTSIATGTEGFMKSAFLGITLTPEMTGAQVADSALMALSRGMAMSPAAGPGAQFMSKVLEDGNIFARQDVVLARQLLSAQQKGNTLTIEEMAERARQMSFEQAWQGAMFSISKVGMNLLMGIAKVVDKFRGVIPVFIFLASGIRLTVSLLGSMFTLWKTGLWPLFQTIGAGFKALLQTKFFDVGANGLLTPISGLTRSISALSRAIPLLGTAFAVQQKMADPEAGTWETVGAGAGSLIGAAATLKMLAGTLPPVTPQTALLKMALLAAGAWIGSTAGGGIGASFDDPTKGLTGDVLAGADWLAHFDRIEDFNKQLLFEEEELNKKAESMKDLLEEQNATLEKTLAPQFLSAAERNMIDQLHRVVLGIDRLGGLTEEANDQRIDAANLNPFAPASGPININTSK